MSGWLASATAQIYFVLKIENLYENGVADASHLLMAPSCKLNQISLAPSPLLARQPYWTNAFGAIITQNVAQKKGDCGLVQNEVGMNGFGRLSISLLRILFSPFSSTSPLIHHVGLPQSSGSE
jgi:hypothetical protein